MNESKITQFLEYNEEVYIVITDLQCARNAIACLGHIYDERAKEAVKILYQITDDLEKRLVRK